MIYDVVWSQTAQDQLNNIHDYYNEIADFITAQALARLLVESSITLENHPERCPIEPQLSQRNKSYRFLLVGNFKLIYSIEELKKMVFIAGLFDTRMDPNKIKSV